MSSQLVSKIGTKLCAHERRTYVHPGDLLTQLHRHGSHHEDIRISDALWLCAMVAIGSEPLEEQSPSHRNSGIAGAEILLGAIKDRRDTALAGASLHPHPRQALKPGRVLGLLGHSYPVLRGFFLPIARIRVRYGMVAERMVAGMPAFAAPVSLFKDLASLRQ